MRKFILALSLLAASAVQAGPLEIEIGTGTTHYKTAHDGLWYQEAYPHSFDLTSAPFSLGVSKVIGQYRYRAEYLYLGWMYTKAQWVPDAQYGTGAPPTRRANGVGSAAGVVLSVSRPVPVLGLPLYAEAGIWAYQPKWKSAATNMDGSEPRTFETERAWRFGPALGFGVRYSGVDVGIRYLGMQHNGDEESPPIYDRAYTVQIKAYF